MTRVGGTARRTPAALAAVVITALTLAACGSAHPAARPGADSAAGRSAASLATSLAGADGTGWAVVDMGGSAASFNNFWELFARPAGSDDWKLVTPTGVASNGGLVMTQSGSSTVVTGFRPSQDLTFSPLAASADAGAAWSQQPPLSPGLANVPSALAGDSAGQLLALTDAGDVDSGAGPGATWTRLTTLSALAATAAGRACGLTALTAVAWTPSGAPLAAGDCGKPGATGIFTESSGTWHAAGPTLTGGAAGTGTGVLGLATTDGQTSAILATGSGAASGVVAAWSADGGAHWTLSPVLRTGGLAAGARPSVSFSADGSAGVVFATPAADAPGGRAYTIGWQASGWHPLPQLPARSAPGQLATLAQAADGAPQALVVHGGTLAVWQLGSGQWTRVQTLRITIPYGSSS
jgi:hypothetical protein